MTRIKTSYAPQETAVRPALSTPVSATPSMTALTLSFGPPDIARWFTPDTIRRAQHYNRAVSDPVLSEVEIKARVQGSARQPYQVRIVFYQGNGSLQIDATCTCPVAYFCKHCVAVLVATLSRHPPISTSNAALGKFGEDDLRALLAPLPGK